MRILHKTLLAVIMAIASGAVIAGDVPSCYQAHKLPPTPAPGLELFVLIDQTTLLDEPLKRIVTQNVGPMLKHGNAFTVGRFSSFSQQHYSEVIASGYLEPQLSPSDRDSTGVKVLKSFDACLDKQMKFAAGTVWKTMTGAMNEASSDLAKSDVMASLRDFSARVRQSSAKERVVLVVSDMLENSSAASFYASRAVRKIDAGKELASASKHGLLGDFGGARVYVIGTGMLAEDAASKKGIYRSPEVMLALSDFWREYFHASNADLKELGQPALLMPVR